MKRLRTLEPARELALAGAGYAGRRVVLSFEDRQALLGHKAAHITTHYSAADISNL